MANIIDPKKKHSQHWKCDPQYEKGCDYDDPKYADVPDDLKWALPIHEAINKPEEMERQKRLKAEVEARVDFKG